MKDIKTCKKLSRKLFERKNDNDKNFDKMLVKQNLSMLNR